MSQVTLCSHERCAREPQPPLRAGIIDRVPSVQVPLVVPCTHFPLDLHPRSTHGSPKAHVSTHLPVPHAPNSLCIVSMAGFFFLFGTIFLTCKKEAQISPL